MAKGCILCSSTENRKVFTEFGVDILQCRGCSHVFSGWDGDQDYDGYFGTVLSGDGDREWWYDAHKSMYHDFTARFLSTGEGRLLDYGCGLGFFVKHVGENSTWRAHGLELSPAAVDFARNQLGLDTVRRVGEKGSSFDKKTFDIITLWDVIEHIPDPHPFLSGLLPYLRDNGRLFLHTPNVHFQMLKARLKKGIHGMDPKVHYLEPRDHLHLYSMNTLSRLLEDHGFSKVRFVHLRPIRGVSRNNSGFSRALKNLWFHGSCILFHLSAGRVNFDNLFVVATK